MATPCWCSPTSDPGSPELGSSGFDSFAGSATFYVGVGGDLTGVTNVFFVGVWDGDENQPTFNGEGSFTFPHTGEVGVFSGMPTGRLEILCFINGELQETRLYIEFDGGAATVQWGVLAPLESALYLHDDFIGAEGLTINDRVIPIQEGTSGLTWSAPVASGPGDASCELDGDGFVLMTPALV